MGAMHLKLNGDDFTLDRDGATVVDLIDALDLTGHAVAVEVNKQLVFKRDHATTALHDGDAVELVTLVGGG